MPTIKDVAKMANVSIGTASNVIRGKRVRPELERRVEQAIASLGYKPDSVARQMKTDKTNVIGVVLPNLDSPYKHILAGIDQYLGNFGYSYLIEITKGSQFIEFQSLERLRQSRVAGFIISSCTENCEKYERFKQSECPIVFIDRKPPLLNNVSEVAFDNSKALTMAIEHAAAKGRRHFALVSEYAEAKLHKDGADITSHRSIVDIYAAVLTRLGFEATRVSLVDSYKERAFAAAFDLLQTHPEIDAVVTTSFCLAEGICEAALMNGRAIPSQLDIITYCDESHIHVPLVPYIQIERSSNNLGELAARTLIERLSSPIKLEKTSKRIPSVLKADMPCAAGFELPKTPAREGIKARFLMLDSNAARSAMKLIPFFTQQTGIAVEMELLAYDDLYRACLTQLREGGCDHDGFMLDLTWLPQLRRTGELFALDSLLKLEQDPDCGFIDGLLKSYGWFDGAQYGLPFMPGTQLLFYRKDCFDDPQVRRSFYRENGMELRPPETWAEFNIIASFFTKQYNPGSPTNYGITAGTKYDGQIVTDFCSRKWAYGGRSFDPGFAVTIGSPEVLVALQNYCASFRYAPPWHHDNWWDEEVRDFCAGEAAMAVIFDSHASKINDRELSAFNGSVGFAPIPGKSPTLGGWVLSANGKGRYIEEACAFIEWICSSKTAMAFSSLGGITARKEFFRANSLLNLYPWMPIALESYRTSRRRAYSGDRPIIQERRYEMILAGEIRAVLSRQITEETALRRMREQLIELVESEQH